MYNTYFFHGNNSYVICTLLFLLTYGVNYKDARLKVKQHFETG